MSAGLRAGNVRALFGADQIKSGVLFHDDSNPLYHADDQRGRGPQRDLSLAYPARAYDGQVLRIGGVATNEGAPAGILVLTLNVLAGETTHRPTSVEETVLVAGERAQRFAAAGAPALAPAAAPLTPLVSPYVLQPASMRPAPAPMRTSLLALLGMVLIVLLGGSLGGIVLITKRAQARALAQGTATVLAGQVSATGAARATAAPQYVTATALAQAAASSAALPDPYAGGKPLVNDALQHNGVGTNWFWQEDSHCVFSAGGYHVIDASSQFIQDCDLDTASQLINYAVEVKMAIVRGDVGGVVFLDDPLFAQQDLGYMLAFDTRGNYQLLSYASQTPTRLAGGQSAAFHTGCNQVNTIGIVASGSTLTWYANG